MRGGASHPTNGTQHMGANIHAISLTAFALFNTAAHAELGASLEPGQSESTPLAGASLYTQRQADGVTVRQYANRAGRVFGVGWEGPLLPDFQRLLGPHYAAYAEAQQLQPRHIHIQNNELVLDAGGMMRSFSGHAYLPKLLPPSLAAQDIR
jgi:hypothetical protein